MEMAAPHWRVRKRNGESRTQNLTIAGQLWSVLTKPKIALRASEKKRCRPWLSYPSMVWLITQVCDIPSGSGACVLIDSQWGALHLIHYMSGLTLESWLKLGCSQADQWLSSWFSGNVWQMTIAIYFVNQWSVCGPFHEQLCSHTMYTKLFTLYHFVECVDSMISPLITIIQPCLHWNTQTSLSNSKELGNRSLMFFLYS